MRPTYRRLTQRERMFIQRHGHSIKCRDLAAIIGRSNNAAYKLRWKYNKRPRTARISLTTAKRIFSTGTPQPDLRFAGEAAFNAQRHWEHWQIVELTSRAGKSPLKDIAASVGKTALACRRKCWRLGIEPSMHTVRHLATRLTIPVVTVAGWCGQGSGTDTGYRVRHHREGRFIVVHRDDAEWLLEHKEQARRGEFEDHPGKLHEYEIEDGEE